MCTKVKTTSRKHILLKLFNEIDYKIMASTTTGENSAHDICIFLI